MLRQAPTRYPLRQHVRDVIESKVFSAAMLTIIFVNTFLIALQTDQMAQMKADWYLSVVDNVFLGIYILELILKFYVHRSRFFKSGWNNFDLFIVLASFMEYIQFAVQSFSTLNPKILRVLRVFRAVRAVRALRVLRTISFLKNLQVIVSTLLNSIPAMGSIILLLFLVSYVFAIMGVRMFRETMPSKFGSMYTASFTLFQLITLDDWFELYDEIRTAQASGSAHEGVHPVFIYFFVYIVTENFIFVNLFTAVIVNNLETHQQGISAPADGDDKNTVREARVHFLAASPAACAEGRCRRTTAQPQQACRHATARGAGAPPTVAAARPAARRAATIAPSSKSLSSTRWNTAAACRRSTRSPGSRLAQLPLQGGDTALQCAGLREAEQLADPLLLQIEEVHHRDAATHAPHAKQRLEVFDRAQCRGRRLRSRLAAALSLLHLLQPGLGRLLCPSRRPRRPRRLRRRRRRRRSLVFEFLHRRQHGAAAAGQTQRFGDVRAAQHTRHIARPRRQLRDLTERPDEGLQCGDDVLRTVDLQQLADREKLLRVPVRLVVALQLRRHPLPRIQRGTSGGRSHRAPKRGQLLPQPGNLAQQPPNRPPRVAVAQRAANPAHRPGGHPTGRCGLAAGPAQRLGACFHAPHGMPPQLRADGLPRRRVGLHLQRDG